MISEKQLELYAKDTNILIVDNDNNSLSILKDVLSNYFSNITTAVDGKEAWEKYSTSTKKFDLVISDVKMPNMDGIELARKLKNDNQDNSIIILSDINDVESFTKLINIGIDGFVIKPFIFDKLARRIINILESKAYQVLMKELNKNTIIEEYKLSQGIIEVEDNVENSYDDLANDIVNVSSHNIFLEENHSLTGNEKSANEIFFELEKTLNEEEFNKVKQTIKDIISKSQELDDCSEELIFFIENLEVETDYSKAEILLNDIIDIVYDMYYMISSFKDLEDIADEFLEIYNFLKSYRKAETLTKEELECLSLDFVVNDIKRFVHTVFVLKNCSDVMSFKQVFKSNLLQMEMIIQTMEDFVL
jgi:DNA-binding response OmpR family regulator